MSDKVWGHYSWLAKSCPWLGFANTNHDHSFISCLLLPWVSSWDEEQFFACLFVCFTVKQIIFTLWHCAETVWSSWYRPLLAISRTWIFTLSEMGYPWRVCGVTWSRLCFRKVCPGASYETRFWGQEWKHRDQLDGSCSDIGRVTHSRVERIRRGDEYKVGF